MVNPSTSPSPSSSMYRLALEAQLDILIEESSLSHVLHALVEVLYHRIQRYAHADPLRAANLRFLARGLTRIELESDTFGLGRPGNNN